MIAYAKQQGITAFFAWTPRKAAAPVRTHWAGLDGQRFTVPAGDARCLLVGTEGEDPFFTQAFFARLVPCSEPLSDGLVCESAMAAPPPPPGSAAGAPPPPAPPPPPPLLVQAALREFVGDTVAPHTEALCLAGLVDSDRVAVCREFAATLAAPRSMGLLPSVTALCEQELCYHSCGGVDGVDGDGFDVCKHVGCADSPCLDFLKRACPEGLHDELDRLYDAVCAVGSPSPPGRPRRPRGAVAAAAAVAARRRL